MGNRFEITVIHPDPSFALNCIEAAVNEIKRIEKLLTTFSDDSATNQVNAMAGIAPVRVPSEMLGLVIRSLKISELTQGAFDITYGSNDKSFWNFDTGMSELPPPEVAKQLVRLINYKNVIIDGKKETIFLREKGMRIGFGGIGKGYAADRAKELLVQMGIHSGIVNAAGDLITWGNQPDAKPWTAGIADPNAQNHVFSSLPISNMAIATSGNYEKFAIIDGKRYSHTIDPKTGYPASGIKSASVICPIAELADALATPIIVMGVEASLSMVNQMKGIACIIIDDNDRLYASKNINLQYHEI